MKKLLGIAVLVFGMASVSFAQDFTEMLDSLNGSLTEIFQSITSNVAYNLDNNMQFYGSAGNVYPPNVSPYFGLKFGVGIGVNFPGLLVQYGMQAASGEMPSFESGLTNTDPNASIFDAYGAAVGQIIALAPFPYDMVFVKLGLPEGLLVLPFLKYADVGLRIGYLPNIADLIGNLSSTSDSGTSAGLALTTSMVHIGAELRTILIGKPRSLFNIDLRGSVDFDYGLFGATATFSQNLSGTTNSTAFDVLVTGNFGLNFAWTGVNIGVKSIASVNVRVIKLYAGLGLNMNIGNARSEMFLTGGFDTPLGPVDLYSNRTRNTSWYDLFDARILGGVTLFGFFNVAAEMSITRMTTALTIMPLCLAF